MPRITAKFDEARKFALVDEDVYRTKILEAEENEGPNSDYLKFTFEIIEGVESGDKFAGQYLWRNCPINGKGSGIFADLWEKVTGEEIDLGPDAPDLDLDTDDLIGLEVMCRVKHKEYEGEQKAEVKGFLKAS